jgi:carbamoyltransferase
MVLLGISAFYHDSAVCLFEDGKVIAAIEEEKLSGIKHDNSFPIKAIKWV